MRGHPRGLCENDSTNTVSARENVKHFCYCAREFIVGHFCGLSENDRKSCCHFQKAREDVPILDFSPLWGPVLHENDCTPPPTTTTNLTSSSSKFRAAITKKKRKLWEKFPIRVAPPPRIIQNFSNFITV